MHNDKRLLSGLLIGAVAVIGGFAAHAHEWHPRGDGMQGGNFLSISGSPEELSKRTRELGEHICETIKPGTDCPVSSISDTAANELAAMQESFAEGQGRLHAALTAAKFDRTAVDQVQAAQATAIHAGEVRWILAVPRRCRRFCRCRINGNCSRAMDTRGSKLVWSARRTRPMSHR